LAAVAAIAILGASTAIFALDIKSPAEKVTPIFYFFLKSV